VWGGVDACHLLLLFSMCEGTHMKFTAVPACTEHLYAVQAACPATALHHLCVSC
jgi:hypothetical protein